MIPLRVQIAIIVLASVAMLALACGGAEEPAGAAAEAAADGMEPQRPQSIPPVQWTSLRKALSCARVTRYESTAEFMRAFGAGKTREPAITVDEVRHHDEQPEGTSG